MTSLTLVAVIQASILMTTATSNTTPTATPQNSYRAARKDCSTTGRPMIVLVGAKWCPACVEMKNKIFPNVKRTGLLRKVAFAEVDLDQQNKLGRELTNGGPIPQVIMYRKTKEGWRRRRLIGGQSVKTLTAFIEEGIRLGKKTKATPSKKDSKNNQPSPKASSAT